MAAISMLDSGRAAESAVGAQSAATGRTVTREIPATRMGTRRRGFWGMLLAGSDRPAGRSGVLNRLATMLLS